MEPNENPDAGSMLYFKSANHKSLVASVHRSVVWSANQYSIAYADMNRPSRPHVLASSRVLSIGALPTENKQAVALTDNGYVRVIHAPANGLAIKVNEVVHVPGATGLATCLKSDSDFVVSVEDEVIQYDATTCKAKYIFEAETDGGDISSMVLLPTGLLTSHVDGGVVGHDRRSGKTMFETKTVPPRTATLSMMGYHVYTGSLDYGIGMLDVRNPKEWTKIHSAPSTSIYATETKIITCDPVGDVYSFFHGNLAEYIRTRLGSCVHVGYTGEVIVVAG